MLATAKKLCSRVGYRMFSFMLEETKYEDALYKATVKDYDGSINILEDIAATHANERNTPQYKQLLRKILAISIISGKPYSKQHIMKQYLGLVDKHNSHEMQDTMNIIANYYPEISDSLHSTAAQLDPISAIYYSVIILQR